MRATRPAAVALGGALVLALAACTGGPPSPEAIARELATPIEPAWETAVPGIFGEVAIADGVVLAYALDDELGMRLTAHDLATGELEWEHAASPGGAYSNPFLVSGTSASRSYPLPAIAPYTVERGEGDDARSVVVFFEREIPEEGTIRPDDLLRVADVRTGELLEVTIPDLDPEEFTFDPLRWSESGDPAAMTYTPTRRCGDELCWITDDSENFGGYGLITLDPQSLEARYRTGVVPDSDDALTPEWAIDLVRISHEGDTDIARYADGDVRWRVASDALFDDERMTPAELIDATVVGDLLLLQGYHAMRETLDPALPHTLDLDIAASRTLVAVDADSGELVWRLPGADMLCHAVHGRAIEADAERIPACLATGGSFSYDIDADELLDEEPIEASIVELEVATGDIGWEVEEAGVVSLAHVARLLPIAYASRGDLTIVDRGDETGLVDLRDGAWYPASDDAILACQAERDDVDPEFEGSTFTGGLNPIATGYPAGWYAFPCDPEGEEADGWSRGAVRVAGLRAAGDDARVVLATEGGLVAFELD